MLESGHGCNNTRSAESEGSDTTETSGEMPISSNERRRPLMPAKKKKATRPVRSGCETRGRSNSARAVRPSTVSCLERQTPQPDSEASEAVTRADEGSRKSITQKGRAHWVTSNSCWEAGETPWKGKEDISSQTARPSDTSSRRQVVHGIQRPQQNSKQLQRCGVGRQNEKSETDQAGQGSG